MRSLATHAWFWAAVALLGGCASTTWTSAWDAARSGGSRLEEAELALIAGDDPVGAAGLSEEVLGAKASAEAERLRAFLALTVACDALGAIERPLPHLAGALDRAVALDAPDQAEWIAAQASRAWARLDGRSAASPQVRAALERVVSVRGDRWERARNAASRELITARRLQGGPEAASRAVAEAGFIQAWRLSAPWGDAPLIDFDTPLGPETRSLAIEEVTDSGMTPRPIATTRGQFSDGEVTFFDLPATGGVGFAEAVLERQAAGVVRLRLEANRLARVFVAAEGEPGREVVARVALDGPWLSEGALALPAGRHRVTVKFASHDGRGFFRLQASALDAMPAGPRPQGRLAAGDGAQAIARLLALERRASRPIWDPRGATLEVAELEQAMGAHPSLDLLAARLALGDSSTPESERRSEARRRYEAVLARIPDHPVALRGLARLERDEDRLEAAMSRLERSATTDPRTALELLDLLRHRGWEVEALRLADSLLPLAESSPRASQEVIDTYRAFGRIPEAQRLTERLELTFPGTGESRLAELMGDRGNPAADKLAAAWSVEPQRHAALRSAVAAYRAKGALDEAEALIQRFLADRPHDGWALGELARIALQRGDADLARRRSAAVLARHPDFAPFESLVAQLSGEPERFDVLADGQEVLAAYRRFAETPEGQKDQGYPVVTVLDRVEVEVRLDGSTLELSHRIRLVQSKQGADALGDVKPPDGARLVVARTLKRDGRLLEPERTEGKAELSFPELEPGDAVETAWVTRSRVSPSEGGYLTGVAFASWSPVHRLEARYLIAPGLTIATTPFGAVPQPSRSTLADGREVIAWTLDRIAATPREPLSVSARSFFPFADLRVVSTHLAEPAEAWRHLARAYTSRILRLTQRGPRMDGLARSFAKASDPAVAAFSWVKRDLNDGEQLNAFETPVEAALAAKTGNRALVLYAALSALARDGQEAELLVCAPERDGPPEDRASPTPNANRFFYPVVAFRAGAVRYFDPARPYTPSGDLPAELQGARCLAPLRHASPDGPFVELPRLETAATFEVEVDLTLTADGAATGRIRGLARGAAGSPLRQAYIAQDAERRRLLFEQWLGSLFTGARLLTVEVSDENESERPMRWTLTFEIPSFAQRDRDRLVAPKALSGLVASDFAGVPALAQLVSAPTRATPLRLFPYTEDVVLRLSWPQSLSLESAPAPHDLNAGGVALTQDVKAGAARLEVRRSVRIAPGRVEPARYPEVRAAIAAALFAFEAPLVLKPGSP